MLRQLIGKYGIMSIELQSAFESDMAAIKEDGSKVYVDNEDITAFEQIDVSTENKVEKTLVWQIKGVYLPFSLNLKENNE